MDYLSFLTLRLESCPQYPDFDRQDYMVLNSVTNVSKALYPLGIKYFTWLIRLLTGKTITDPTSGLRMINKDIIQYFAKEYPRDYPEPESIVAVLKRKKKVQEIPVIMRARAGGVSSISPLNSIYYMVKVTIAILIERIR